MSRPGILVTALLLPPLAAQAAAAPKTEAEGDPLIVKQLLVFARSAEKWKAPAQARAIYEEILEHYDTDQPNARVALGFKKVDGEWKATRDPSKLPADSASANQQRLIAETWSQACKQIVPLHKSVGAALLAAGDQTRGRYQFERALRFAPDDAESHRALGHEEIDSFFGTPEQVAFVKRMRELLALAQDIAGRDIQVEPVADDRLPAELRVAKLECHGARSSNYTFWATDNEEAAAHAAAWAERAVLLLHSLLANHPEQLDAHYIKWVVLLRDDEQRNTLLEASYSARDSESIERAKLFGGSQFNSSTGRAEWVVTQVDNDADLAVALVTKRCASMGFNTGLSEGMVHVMTMLLCGSVRTRFFELASTTAGGGDLLEREPAAWLRRLRDEIDAGKDWALVDVPREKLENFRDSARIKAWSFMLWMIARYPDSWLKLAKALDKQAMQPEQVAAIFKQVLDRDVGDVEAEWRAWARRGSAIGKVSGLPE